MFFVKPAKKLNVEVQLDRENYVPGETVNFEVLVTDDEGNLVEDDTFVSVFITDDSVFSRVEQRKQPPTIASQVLLEHEVKKNNYNFDYSRDYVEHMFSGENENSSDENLELLLSVQQWRFCIFCLPYIRDNYEELRSQSDLGEQAEEKQNLYGIHWEEEQKFLAQPEMVFFDFAMANMAGKKA